MNSNVNTIGVKCTVYYWVIAFVVPGAEAFGQNEKKISQDIAITGSYGKKNYSMSFSYDYNRRFGKASRFELGLGTRVTSYLGKDKEYLTAPVKLTKGKRGPTVLFKAPATTFIDTLFIKTPQIHSLNLSINMGYRLFPKLVAGFNIDLIGLSVGKSQASEFVHEGRKNVVNAKPAFFNFLLIDDNAYGSLNSEFYALYNTHERWALKFFYQYLYLEYSTSENVQNENGILNDRFRDKPGLWGLGLIYYLK